MEKTLVLIKPDGVQRGLIGPIISKFESKGLKLIGMKFIQMSDDLARTHYSIHRDKSFFEPLVAYIISAPVVAMEFAVLSSLRRLSAVSIRVAL